MAYTTNPYQTRYATTSDSYQPSTISLLNPTASNSTIRTGTTSPYQGTTGTSGLGGSNTGGSTTYYSNAPTIGTGSAANRTTSLSNAPTGYGGYTGQPMTTQPVGPSSQPTGGNPTPMPTVPNWWENYPTGPSGPSGNTGQSPLDNQLTYPTPTTTPGTQPGTQATGGGTEGFTWQVPQWMRGLTPQQWADPTIQQAVANYMAGSLPFTQLQQNSYQYTNDFNEAQRRWNDQFGWTQQTDQFNMGLAQQQQNLAKWMAEQQQGNWQNQYSLDSELGRRNADATDYANSTNRWNITQQRNNELTQIQNQDWYNRAQTNIAQQQATIDKAYKEGQISNQQRELALAELTQQQLNVYRNAQLAQEGALTREGYANQQAIARMNAFGRTQAPRARWVRAW